MEAEEIDEWMNEWIEELGSNRVHFLGFDLGSICVYAHVCNYFYL